MVFSKIFFFTLFKFDQDILDIKIPNKEKQIIKNEFKIKFNVFFLLKDIKRPCRSSMRRFYMQRAFNCQRRSKIEPNKMRRMQTGISSQK
jgi:hypothetical protein